ncbi:hypothetical protein Salat_0508100 [Sesamum alatum]|uniref:Uncharacterized protein n=1 Tax=Sesamum alatum TaxID=300844 RepID=A0AAE1Z4C5_9LAMI|nr:hypothetical protein Salat_0508100 [Sesamum alatum]
MFFLWVVARPDVVWNRNLRFLVAEDRIWKLMCQERKKAKWYINTYEDLYEELCMLFGDRDDKANNDAVTQPIDLNVPQADVVVGDVSPPKNVDKASHNNVVLISDSSDSSSSLWGYIEELLGSGSDADSVLPLSGVPASHSKKKGVMPQSPPSFHSVGGNSSSASNPTPKKNVNLMDTREQCSSWVLRARFVLMVGKGKEDS